MHVGYSSSTDRVVSTEDNLHDAVWRAPYQNMLEVCQHFPESTNAAKL